MARWIDGYMDLCASNFLNRSQTSTSMLSSWQNAPNCEQILAPLRVLRTCPTPKHPFSWCTGRLLRSETCILIKSNSWKWESLESRTKKKLMQLSGAYIRTINGFGFAPKKWWTFWQRSGIYIMIKKKPPLVEWPFIQTVQFSIQSSKIKKNSTEVHQIAIFNTHSVENCTLK